MTEYKATGKYYEDFKVGDEFCTVSRTITEADIVNFAGVSGDFIQLHTSEEYAKGTVHKGRIAHGLLSLAISTGEVSQSGLFDGTILAYLNTSVDFKSVVRIGDTIRTIIKVVELRETKKPGVAVMKTVGQVYNQNDIVVLEHTDTVMIMCRPTK